MTKTVCCHRRAVACLCWLLLLSDTDDWLDFRGSATSLTASRPSVLSWDRERITKKKESPSSRTDPATTASTQRDKRNSFHTMHNSRLDLTSIKPDAAADAESDFSTFLLFVSSCRSSRHDYPFCLASFSSSIFCLSSPSEVFFYDYKRWKRIDKEK